MVIYNKQNLGGRMFGKDNQNSTAPVMTPVTDPAAGIQPSINSTDQYITPSPVDSSGLSYGPALPPSTDEVITNPPMAPQITQPNDGMPSMMPASESYNQTSSAPVLDNEANLDTSTVPAPAPEEPIRPNEEAGLVDKDLLAIKQEALGKLSPLVHKLDQSPQEKFHTMMMMIQASDDQTLISSAYETAQLITDEKERAQALLDIVNEINYFTQKTANNS